MKGVYGPKTLIEAKRLSLIPPNEAYTFFENHKDENIIYQLSEILLENDNELINLAIARFSKNADVLKTLFNKTSDEAIRCALLSNIEFPFGVLGIINDKHTDLINVLENGTGAEVAALVSNPSIKGETLALIFRREGWARHLDDERWFLCCTLALDNPNLCSEYKSSAPLGYHDGYFEFLHNNAIKEAWNLFLKAPLTSRWAINLSHQFSANHIVRYHVTDTSFYGKVLTRWISDDPENDYSFQNLRTYIASIAPHDKSTNNWFSDHQDKDIRIGYYYTFSTSDTDDLDRYYMKDGDDFITAAISNENLFINETIRDRLRKLVDKNCKITGYYDDLDIFDITYERVTSKNPHILSDWLLRETEYSKPMSIGLSKDQHEELKKRLDELEERLLEKLSKRKGFFG